MSDALREILGVLEKTGSDGNADYSALMERLRQAQTMPAQAPVEASVEKQTENAAFGFFDDEPQPSVPPPPETEGNDPPSTPTPAPVPSPAAAPSSAPQAKAISTPVAAPGTAPKHSVSDNAIRVDVSQLDRLMNLVGELVLARNQIALHNNQTHQAALTPAASTSQRLNIITTELQESVMKTRMQPISNIWATCLSL